MNQQPGQKPRRLNPFEIRGGLKLGWRLGYEIDNAS